MRTTYRGITLIQITGGVWITSLLPGRIFFSDDELKRAIDSRHRCTPY